jgi:uncharacterized membrane protein
VQDNGVFTTLDAPRTGSFTAVFGIDDSGKKTVGGYVDSGGTLHGFLRDDRRFTNIDFLGAKATLVARMNARGQIVGAYSEDATTPALDLPHGFLLEGGVFTRIDFPGAARTHPFGINSRGQIVGQYRDTGGTSHGFLLDQGVFTTIAAPFNTSTLAADIDDRGRVVGISYGGAGAAQGFLRVSCATEAASRRSKFRARSDQRPSRSMTEARSSVSTARLPTEITRSRSMAIFWTRVS